MNNKYVLGIGAIILGLSLGVVGCGNGASQANPTITNETANTSNTDSNTNSSDGISDVQTSHNSSDFVPNYQPSLKKVVSSGGIGDTFDTFNQTYGTPPQEQQAMKKGFGQYRYDNGDGSTLVSYVDGRANNISYGFDNNLKDNTSAATFVKSVIPSDAAKIKTYNTPDGLRVVVYHSDTIAKLFSKDQFENKDGNPEPGVFDVVYTFQGNQVEGITVFTGDNP